jgi:hypothetical protein
MASMTGCKRGFAAFPGISISVIVTPDLTIGGHDQRALRGAPCLSAEPTPVE